MNTHPRRWLAGVLIIAAALLPDAAEAAPAEVKELRVWDAPESTRVVLEFTSAVDYHVFALSSPPRVVLDLKGARRPKDLGYDPTADSPVGAVRLGTPVAGTTRVVLDLRRAQHYEGFFLQPNERYGHRLVVDLYADAPAVRLAEAQPHAPAPSPNPDVVTGMAGKPAQTPASAAPPVAKKPPPRGGRRQAAAPLVIVIDAGHGGEDPGAIGKGGTREKDVVLKIARALAKRVNAEPGMRAVLTRDGDYFLPLRSRVVAAHRADADLFISVHADAAVNRNAHGSGVYALSASGASNEAARLLAAKENAADDIGGLAQADTSDPLLRSVLLDLSQNATIESSLRLAQHMLSHLRGATAVHQSRVQQAGFAVLKSPHVPSVLVETAFISNPTEERKLRDPAFHKLVADTLLEGVRTHVAGDPRLSARLAAARGEAPPLVAGASALTAAARR